MDTIPTHSPLCEEVLIKLHRAYTDLEEIRKEGETLQSSLSLHDELVGRLHRTYTDLEEICKEREGIAKRTTGWHDKHAGDSLRRRHSKSLPAQLNRCHRRSCENVVETPADHETAICEAVAAGLRCCASWFANWRMKGRICEDGADILFWNPDFD
jgi:hypothetical protein